MEIKASAQYSVSVTPSNATSISCKALYIGTGGDVLIKHRSGDATITYPSVPGGFILPVELREGRVMAATGASGIVAMQW